MDPRLIIERTIIERMVIERTIIESQDQAFYRNLLICEKISNPILIESYRIRIL